MKHPYIDELINRNRTGILIKLIKINVHKWSINDFQYIFDQCIKHRLYDIFHFMMDYFIRSDCISFYDNKKYMYFDSVFILICIDGHINLVKYLLSDEVTEKYPDIDPCAQNNFGLSLACMYDRVNMVKYLLANKVTDKYPKIDPCAENNFGLKSACLNGYVDIVEYLLLDEVTKKYPKLHPENLCHRLKIMLKIF